MRPHQGILLNRRATTVVALTPQRHLAILLTLSPSQLSPALPLGFYATRIELRPRRDVSAPALRTLAYYNSIIRNKTMPPQGWGGSLSEPWLYVLGDDASPHE